MRTRAERRGGRLGAQRHEALDHERHARRRSPWSGRSTDDGVRGFLVETDRPGFEARDIKGKFSLRASVTCELFLQDVEVPDANRLPKAEGMKGPLSCLTQARYGIAWGALGAAMACYDEVVDYSTERAGAGRPARRATSSPRRSSPTCSPRSRRPSSSRCASGASRTRAQLHHAMVSMAKRNNVDVALEIARVARDILGANGIIDEYQSMRHMVNLETVRTYEGTHDIHTLILGEHITGMRAL